MVTVTARRLSGCHQECRIALLRYCSNRTLTWSGSNPDLERHHRVEHGSEWARSGARGGRWPVDAVEDVRHWVVEAKASWMAVWSYRGYYSRVLRPLASSSNCRGRWVRFVRYARTSVVGTCCVVPHRFCPSALRWAGFAVGPSANPSGTASDHPLQRLSAPSKRDDSGRDHPGCCQRPHSVRSPYGLEDEQQRAQPSLDS